MRSAVPAGTTEAALFRASLAAALLLAAAMAPLATGLGGGFGRRWMVLWSLLLVSGGVNTAIEAAVFHAGDTGSFLVLSAVGFGAAAAALARWFGPGAPPPARPRRAAASWAWRLAVAWLAFPAIYLFFGACVAPLVTPYYQAGIGGLRLPPMDVIVGTQLLRSALFLASALPVVLSWTASTRRLVLAFGAAHAVVVGLYGMVAAEFLPAVQRLTHSVEITADSFAYALVLALLFGRRRAGAPAVQPARAEHAAA